MGSLDLSSISKASRRISGDRTFISQTLISRIRKELHRAEWTGYSRYSSNSGNFKHWSGDCPVITFVDIDS